MKIAKTRDVKTSSRAHPDDAGIDFYIPNDFETYSNGIFIIHPHDSVLIPSGIIAEVPTGFALIGHDKSGICSKKGLKIGAKVVDENYQGEIHIHLINMTDCVVTVKPGEKIAQFLLIPINYENVELINIEDIHKEKTLRGASGFGHAGSE